MQNAECKMQNFGAYADFYCVLRKQNISHSLNISRVSISHRRYIAIIIANWKWQMANFGTALAIKKSCGVAKPYHPYLQVNRDDRLRID